MIGKKLQVVMLSNEGLGPTIIESQVLMIAKRLSEQGFAVVVVALALSGWRYREALLAKPIFEERYGLNITVVRGVAPMFFASVAINTLRVKQALKKLHAKPEIIHARTEYSTCIALRIKSEEPVRVVWDCRGDTLAEHHFRWTQKTHWLKPLGALAEREIENRLSTARTADAAVFVSRALRSLEVDRGFGGEFEEIANLADPKAFCYRHERRHELRRTLSIPVEAPVLIYVGSTAPWQGLDQAIVAVEQSAKIEPKLHAIFVCDAPDRIETAFSDWIKPRLRLTTSDITEIPDYLNAADAAFLLRSPSAASWVASPIKFAEYLMCGLPVVHNDSVSQLGELEADWAQLVSVDELKSGAFEVKRLPREVREGRALEAAKLLSNERSGKLISSLYQRILASDTPIVGAW